MLDSPLLPRTCGYIAGEWVAERLRFGHLGVNTATGPTPEAPLGGMKLSGYGREGGVEGLDAFCELQTVPRAGTDGEGS